MATKRQSKEPGAIPAVGFDLSNLDRPTEGRFLDDLNAEKMGHLVGVASKVFDHIAEAWKLADEQRESLIEPGKEATVEGLRRVSLLMQIHTYLHTLLPASADGWVHRPNSNSAFGGRTALAMMAADGIQGMVQVRDHLASWAGSL